MPRGASETKSFAWSLRIIILLGNVFVTDSQVCQVEPQFALRKTPVKILLVSPIVPR